MKVNWSVFGYVLIITSLSSLISGCDSSMRQYVQEMLKKCASNDLLGKNIIYFGPTNNLGAGTLFRKFPDGSYQLSLIANSYIPANSGIVHDSGSSSCTGNDKVSISLNGSLTADKLLGAVPVGIGAKLSSAKTASISVASYEWQELQIASYEGLISGLPSDSPIRSAILTKHDRILARALKVSGLKATLTFSSDVAPNIKASIPAKIASGDNLGIDLTAEWKDDHTLQLTANDDAYIAGELRTYSAEGLAGPATLKDETDLEKARVTLQLVDNL